MQPLKLSVLFVLGTTSWTSANAVECEAVISELRRAPLPDFIVKPMEHAPVGYWDIEGIDDIQAGIACSQDGMFSNIGVSVVEGQQFSYEYLENMMRAVMAAVVPGISDPEALFAKLNRISAEDAARREKESGAFYGAAYETIGGYTLEINYSNMGGRRFGVGLD
ncbi:hypothetical protein GTW51_19670 [Aurantimonas aggregata]|uniref:Uncharacterized protein n=1 Tax=Aurantimonas aggregata TaxID=2047720 RepID=A0A6L9MM33_9HYPH|nr:hypothetical protein [Aurantimonas aggregata]NDV88909.1 hypothetical protein [Aurantimonas aggregata]